MEGLSTGYPFRESARRGRSSRRDGSLGTLSRVRGVLSPDLG